MPHIFEVSELASALKESTEGQFPFVWVRGQVSNLAKPSSGHVYFTLKDEAAVLPVVWFSNSRRRVEAGGHDPLTGEVYENGNQPELRDGSEVLCAGRLSVYPPRGVYQLVAELVQERGLGELHLRFELLKRRLMEAGYFAAERKRPLPESPRRLALVTSARGAAIRDFLRVASERGCGCEIRIHHSAVQGDGAAESLAAALTSACEDGWAEMVVLLRGGGSLEDLWAFNEEVLARAIHEASLPVLTGIGHEVDTTIADLTADRRAATPSHAAQLLWPERRQLLQEVDELEMALAGAFDDLLGNRREKVDSLARLLAGLSPAARLGQMRSGLDREARALEYAFAAFFQGRALELDRLRSRLSMSFGLQAVEARTAELSLAADRLERAASRHLKDKEQDLDAAEARLRAYDPMGPLQRGFSLVRLERTGHFLRRVREAEPGDRLKITVGDGDVPAVVRGEE
jgi:exodeoxyribonuclease VII large subunit